MCAVGERVERQFGESVHVVVVDDEDLRVAGKDGAQVLGAGGRDRGAGGVLAAVGDDQRPRALPKRPLHVVRQGAVVVDADRDRPQSEGGDEIEEAAPARVLHRHRVAGSQVGKERALHGVERSGGQPDRPVGDAVGVEGGAGQAAELVIDRGVAVQHGLPGVPGGGLGQRLAE